MKIYKDQLKTINPSYSIWFSDQIEPMIDFPTTWSQEGHPDCKTTYSLNSHGLRCDEFNEIDKTDKHVVFSGCEMTIPMDIDLVNGWSYRIYNDFFKNKNGFRSLSYPGANQNKIIVNLIKYIYKYGKPDNIIILMPEIIRSYGFWNEGGAFKPKMYRQFKSDDGIEHNSMALPNDVPLELLALNYIQSMRVLESICKMSEIDLVWSTWDKETSDIIDSQGFSNFIPISKSLYSQDEIYSLFKNNIGGN